MSFETPDSTRGIGGRRLPRIALDAMGGDFGPAITVAGALAASEDADLLLVGVSSEIQANLASWPSNLAKPRVIDSAQAIGMEEAPAQAFRAKGSSLSVAMELLKGDEADAVVSMGNTGAVLATALSVLGTTPGVDRPALAVVLPSTSSHGFLLLDAGANAEVRPAQLVHFARLGARYMAAITGIARPRIGLLSIGEEPKKGTARVIRAHGLLSATADLNFVGNVEARDMMFGAVDVVVTDGFTGNVVVKLIEGLAQFLFTAFDRSLHLADAETARHDDDELAHLRNALNPNMRGAVPLLGVRGDVFVGHGRSTSTGVASAIRTAALAVAGSRSQSARMIDRASSA